LPRLREILPAPVAGQMKNAYSNDNKNCRQFKKYAGRRTQKLKRQRPARSRGKGTELKEIAAISGEYRKAYICRLVCRSAIFDNVQAAPSLSGKIFNSA